MPRSLQPMRFALLALALAAIALTAAPAGHDTVDASGLAPDSIQLTTD